MICFQKSLSSLPSDGLEKLAYQNRLLQANICLYLDNSVNSAFSEIAFPDFPVPRISDEQQLLDTNLSVTVLLVKLLQLSVHLRYLCPMVPISATMQSDDNHHSVGEITVPKSGDIDDVDYAEDYDSLKRFLSNYPGCWQVSHGQLLQALAEAVWWRDAHAALAVEHSLLPRLDASVQRKLCSLIVNSLVHSAK